MLYEQKVLLKNTKVLKVINSFHNKSFVKFLIFAQPVKIISWDGIENGKVAVFKFWFFGWRTMKVVHKGYINRGQYLSFEDKGLEIPFGLTTWNHHHIVETQKNNVVIIDRVTMNSDSHIKSYLIYPVMIFPILIRKVLYRIWFYRMKNRH
tara:strand:- start:270 stop:722 length:453 start_codon:yes stop_codon:yes gene_type:complete